MSKQVKVVGAVTVAQSNAQVAKAGYTDNAVEAKVSIHNQRVMLVRDEVKNGTAKRIKGYEAHNTLLAGMIIRKKPAKSSPAINPLDKIVPMLNGLNPKQLEFVIKSAKALLK
jgi:hypothetical protein